MRETNGSTLEINGVWASTNANVEQAPQSFVSSLEGYLDEEVRATARDLEMSLDPILAAHANTIVYCEELGGVEMTLSDVINATWPRSIKGAMVKEGLPSVMTKIEKWLNSSRAQPEEDEANESEESEAETAQAEEIDQKNTAQVEEQPDKIDTKPQNLKEKDEPQHLEPVISNGKVLEFNGNQAIDAEEINVPDLSQNEPLPPSQRVVAAETPAISANAGQGAIHQNRSSAPEAVSAPSDPSESSIKKSGTERVVQTPALVLPIRVKESPDIIKREVEAKPQIVSAKIPEADIVVTVIEDESTAEVPQPVTAGTTEPLTMPVATGTGPEFEFAELPLLDVEWPASSAAAVEGDNEKIVVVEDGNSLSDFVEQKALPLDQLAETDLAADQLYELRRPALEGMAETLDGGKEASVFPANDELDFSEPLGASPEQPVQGSLVIDEIENFLVQLAETTEDSQPETVEAVNEILDKILEVPEKLAANNGENFATEVEAQEELEELFTRLLDEMGIDHTPELIESLVHLTLRPHFADKIKKLEDQEEIDQVPQYSGTHEIIKQLLMSLSNIKQTLHACAIGRYALQQGCGLVFGFMERS